MTKSSAMSVPDWCCFQPNFLEKVKTHFHLTDLRCKNTVSEKCIFASKENRRISRLTTRATKRVQDRNLVHVKDEGQRDWIHFVGVGGCGLSALALLAVKQVSFCRVMVVLTENGIDKECFVDLFEY